MSAAPDPRCEHGFGLGCCSACYMAAHSPRESRGLKLARVDVAFRCEQDLVDAMQAAAARSGVAVSVWIRAAIRNALAEEAG